MKGAEQLKYDGGVANMEPLRDLIPTFAATLDPTTRPASPQPVKHNTALNPTIATPLATPTPESDMAPTAIFMQQRPKVSLEVLEPEHYHILVRAIQNVLSTELAELTMAELVDGLPLASTGWGAAGNLLCRDHPLNEHKTFCDGVIDQTRAFRDAFDPRILQLDSWVMQAYQNAEIGSLQFKIRLIELVARSIHQIAVFLFQREPKLHAGDIHSVVSWKAEEEWYMVNGKRRVYFTPAEPRPTLFFHVDYMDYEQYPDGLADMAGYWAEDRIFGGVLVFDRGTAGDGCVDVYFHPGRDGTTFRLWKPLDTQFNSFVDFLLSNEPSPPVPLPLLVSDDNFRRHDPWDAIALHHIFRDPWERKVTPTKPPDRDVRSSMDYPEVNIMFTGLEEAWQAHEDQSSTDNPDDKMDDEGDVEVGSAELTRSLLPISPALTEDLEWKEAESRSTTETREQPDDLEEAPPTSTAHVSTDDQERNEAESQLAAETCEQPGDAGGVLIDRTVDIPRDALEQTKEQKQSSAESCDKPTDSEGAPLASATESVAGERKAEEES